ncbi:hypothetical protein [Enterococcus faecium]|uniref:hypothetical protein n=1 Tax=Enterococcus faecium TaxID=1352 RepID=UPI0015CA16CF|nr:hypothetical protein [Enterococcus faecium]
MERLLKQIAHDGDRCLAQDSVQDELITQLFSQFCLGNKKEEQTIGTIIEADCA